jgi:hypothetical protein
MSTRRKRPSLDRTRPVRSWSATLGTSAEKPIAAEPPRTDGRPRPRLEDAVSKSVELGYKVVDEYIQQGQRAAQRLSEGKLTAEVLSSEVNDLGGRIARYASDFFGAWVELLELAAVGSAARQNEMQIAGNGAPAAEASEAPPARRPAAGGMRVEVQASRPVEVALDLRAERVTGTIRAHELRSAESGKPRLTDVAVRSDGAGKAPILRIGVPDDHPAGAYEGLLVDEGTNRAVGSVRVVVSPPPGARARRGRRPRRRSPGTKPARR